MQLAPVDEEGCRQGLRNPLGHDRGMSRLEQVAQHRNEFVATQTCYQVIVVIGAERDGIAFAHAAEQSRCRFAQDLIAYRMTQCVIDALEPVQVNEECGQTGCLSLGIRYSGLQVLIEVLAIGESGEVVEQSQAAHLLGRAPSVCHVLQRSM